MLHTYESNCGEVKFWIEQEAIHMRVIANGGDPAELTISEARRIAHALLELADEVDSLDGQ